MNYWELSPNQIERLQGGDGGPFRDFVNRLIHAHASVCGIPCSAISTDSTTAPDGGVDCQVSQGADTDSTGWLRGKTCWQFKGLEHSDITEEKLRREVRKPYCATLIGQGYAYRLCIADSLTAEKKARWEKYLEEEIHSLSPDAPPPRVLTSTSLAEWANRYLGVVATYLPFERERLLHLEAWGSAIVCPTGKYVPVSMWEPITNELKAHVDLSLSPKALVLPVHGDAGIGKSRLVYETLASLPLSRPLVVYTDDEEAAQTIAHVLARESSRFAILIVDECSAEARLKIEQRLRGNEQRVRVITIANYVRSDPTPEPTLQRMPNETVDEILKVNFPLVSEERRRAAVSLAGGFVKIAADFCLYDIAGGFVPVTDYYHLRVRDEASRKVIEAISLVKKVGFSGDVSTQFKDLCALTRLDEEESKRRAKKLKDSPGFVAIGGRFFYVTPEAIAQVALEEAWRHWIKDNPGEFFKRVPESLLEEFHDRVAHSGREEFRSAMADYFTHWSSELTPADLGDKKKVDRLVVLVETDPTRFLPSLARLIDRAKPEELMTDNGSRGWGSRRSIVWLCERLSAFPEYFYDVERILFRLALHESERGIGNNATAIWKQIFVILLSGSSLPYCDRLRLLEPRLTSQSPAEAILALDALEGIFETHASRAVGPAVVAGRIPPSDWQPRYQHDYLACYHSAFALYEAMITGGSDEIHSRALDAVIKHVDWFLWNGFLDDISNLLRPPRLGLTNLPTVLEKVDLFLKVRTKGRHQDSYPEEYLKKVRNWQASLIPDDVHAKVISIVGRPTYHFYEGDERVEWNSKLRGIATQLTADRRLLESELPWLTSEAAKSAADLGVEMAKGDPEAKCFDTVVLASPAQNLSLCRGYIFGLVRTHPQHASKLNSFLDRLERSNPQLAFDYAATVPIETDAFGRWARLCDGGLIPAHQILTLAYRLRTGGLDAAEVKVALPRLLTSPEPQAAEAALDVVHTWIHSRKESGASLMTEDTQLWSLIAAVLSRLMPSQVMGSFHWEEAMKSFCLVDPGAAARIASGCLTNKEMSVEEAAERILVGLAKQHPDLMMKELGRALMEEKEAWRLQIRGCRSLLTAVPPQSVMNWLNHTQFEGARKIAGSLPRPFLDENGNPLVPPLTEMVLTSFGSDEKVSRGFICDTGIRSYSGDIVGQRLKEAAVASKFLQHAVPAIREWARREKTGSEHEAERWRQEDEEAFI